MKAVEMLLEQEPNILNAQEDEEQEGNESNEGEPESTDDENDKEDEDEIDDEKQCPRYNLRNSSETRQGDIGGAKH
ncbi:hypothetical protein E0Z10_g3247 [Xylaria hypoxylon]|uniref:Uncharacterized protein n=1 Tax=Xylaria hypoxylon TaxID=37992 RepID=A0A4Z0Z008_9PEZI|nr:hypothetical protein E0Z10_g3247 [Xylaria hypoxylon]